MANYANLKTAIQQVVRTNGNEEITGALLQQTLFAMVNSLGGYYQFAGIATPSTNPGTPDQNVFYFASTAGIYANFGGLVLADGEIAILKYNGAWSKDSTGAASLETVNQLQKEFIQKEIIMTPGYYYGFSGSNIGDVFTGNRQANANYSCAKVQCMGGDVFRLNLSSGGSGRLCFCDANDILILKDMTTEPYDDFILFAPENAAYLYINDNSGRKSYQIGDVVYIKDSIKEIEQSIENLEQPITPERCTFFRANLYNPEDPDIELGKYIQYANGTKANNVNYLITGYIPISRWTEKLIASVNGNAAGGGGFWCLYDSSKQPINIGEQMSTTGGIATWSPGAAFVRFSIAGYAAGKIQVEVGQTVNPYIEYGKTILNPEYLPEDESEVMDNYMRGERPSIGNGESITLMSNRVKSNKRIAFSAKVSAFSSLEIGHGGANYYGGSWLEITGTNIICHNFLSSDSVQTVAHGLTIANTIQIVIEQGVNESCSVKMISNGLLFTHTFAWRGTVGPIYAKSVGSTLTDAVLSWTADGLTQEIWGFGDSYFSLTSDARWTYYLIQDGHIKWLMNGQPGGNSAGAMSDLQNLILLGKPKKILWAMGMNDPDSESAVNTSWNNAYETVKNICEVNGIELILATIPTVSGGTVEDSDVPANLRIHKFKNAIVRASGYRYVDFDKAVNANENTGQWYAGMLSSDGVHPTTAGALTLYVQAVSDLPELLTT